MYSDNHGRCATGRGGGGGQGPIDPYNFLVAKEGKSDDKKKKIKKKWRRTKYNGKNYGSYITYFPQLFNYKKMTTCCPPSPPKNCPFCPKTLAPPMTTSLLLRPIPFSSFFLFVNLFSVKKNLVSDPPLQKFLGQLLASTPSSEICKK